MAHGQIQTTVSLVHGKLNSLNALREVGFSYYVFKQSKKFGLSFFCSPALAQNAGANINLCPENAVDKRLYGLVDSRQTNLSQASTLIRVKLFKLSVGAGDMLNLLNEVAIMGRAAFIRIFLTTWVLKLALVGPLQLYQMKTLPRQWLFPRLNPKLVLGESQNSPQSLLYEATS